MGTRVRRETLYRMDIIGGMMKNKQLQIINHYGFEAQKAKLKEEMTELAYAPNEENFIEEIADVLNVLQGIIYFRGWEQQVLQIQEAKLDRQLKRIEEGK